MKAEKLGSFQRFRTWFQKTHANGFWFPPFQKIITWAYTKISIGNRFEHWIAQKQNFHAGSKELYQLAILIIGVAWLLVIDYPIHPIFSNQPSRLIGIGLSIWLITELFFFSLHWIFVATGRLISIQRSLASFLLNLIEIAIYFSIIFLLTPCQTNYSYGATNVYENFKSIIKLNVPTVSQSAVCSIFAHYEWIVGTTLLGIIITGLTGAIVRDEIRTK